MSREGHHNCLVCDVRVKDETLYPYCLKHPNGLSTPLTLIMVDRDNQKIEVKVSCKTQAKAYVYGNKKIVSGTLVDSDGNSICDYMWKQVSPGLSKWIIQENKKVSSN